MNQYLVEWGFKGYFSCYNSNSRGVAILLNNNFEYKVYNTYIDEQGNYIALDIEISDLRFTLMCIYGPNKDEPEFYKKITQKIEEFENASLIICGDWNLVQNQDMDTKNYKHENNIKSRSEVLKMKQELELVDPWRENNPNSKRFTWRCRNPVRMARLDFFLTSNDIYTLSEKCFIEPGYRPDHSIITLKLHLKQRTQRQRILENEHFSSA